MVVYHNFIYFFICQFMQLVVDGFKEYNKVIFFCRSVEEQERPFALGMQFVLLRTLGKS